MNDKIKKLKNDYENIEIPKELDLIVETAIKEGKKEDINILKEKKMKFLRYKKFSFTIASVLIVFASAVNINSTFAESMENIPVVGSVAKLVNFRTYKITEKDFDADINISQVQGLDDEKLENELNTKFIKEGQAEYDNFLKQMEEIKVQGGTGHISIKTDYEVKTDNDAILSIIYAKYSSEASSDIQYKTYTIDKKNKAVVSLESLFKDSSYIDVISDYIKKEMEEEMANDNSKVYFINEEELGDENFDKINKAQNFYINDNGKLVILFDKYEVAPGYMGAIEFEIPTNIINNILLDRNLIK